METNKGEFRTMIESNSYINHYSSDDDRDTINEFENFEPLGHGIAIYNQSLHETFMESVLG